MGGVRGSDVPEVLYKYYSVLDEDNRFGIKWTRFVSLISEGSIYLSHPDQFNDPFDANPHVVVPKLFSRAFLRSLDSAGKRMGHSQRERRETIRRYIARGLESHALGYSESARKHIRKLGVFCTTITRDNPLMWAHYAASHSGVCVGFRTEDSILSISDRVAYSNERPQWDESPKGVATLRNILITKPECWSYEEEHRLLSLDASDPAENAAPNPSWPSEVRRFLARNPGPGIFNLDCRTIRSLTFGCKCPPEVVARVTDLVKSASGDIELYQARLSDESYTLTFVPIPL